MTSFVTQSHSFHLMLDSTNSQILVSSPGANQILGYNASSLENKRLIDLSNDLTPPLFSNIVKNLRLGRESIFFLHAYLKKNPNLKFERQPLSLDSSDNTSGKNSSTTNTSNERTFHASHSRSVEMDLDFQFFEFEFQKVLIVTGHSISESLPYQRSESPSPISKDAIHESTDSIPEMVLVKDADGCFLFLNQAVADLYNLSVEDLLFRNQSQFHPNKIEYASIRKEEEEDIISNWRSCFVQRRIVDSNGHERIFWVKKIPFMINSESPAILAISKDITDIQQGEELRRENGYRSLLDFAMIGTCTLRSHDAEVSSPSFLSFSSSTLSSTSSLTTEKNATAKATAAVTLEKQPKVDSNSSLDSSSPVIEVLAKTKAKVEATITTSELASSTEEEEEVETETTTEEADAPKVTTKAIEETESPTLNSTTSARAAAKAVGKGRTTSTDASVASSATSKVIKVTERKAKLPKSSSPTTDTEAEATINTDAEATANEEVEATAYAEAEATTDAKAEATTDAKAEATANEEVEVTAYAEAEVTAYAEAEVTAYAEAEVTAYAEAEVTAYAEAEATTDAKAEVTAYAEAEATTDAKAEATTDAKAEATTNVEVKATANADAKATGNADAKATANVDAKATANVDAKATGNAEVEATANADAKATGNAEVEATANVDAKATGNAEVEATAKEKNGTSTATSIVSVTVAGKETTSTTSKAKAEASGVSSSSPFSSFIPPSTLSTSSNSNSISKYIITSCNHGLEHLLGYSRDDLIGEKIKSLMLSDDVSKFQEFIDGFIHNDIASCEQQYQFVAVDGKIVWIRLIFTKLDSKVGHCVACMFEDITNQKDIKSKLLFEQDKFKVLFEICTDPLLVMDQNLEILDCNQALVRILGYQNKEEVLQFKTPYDLSPYKQPDGQISKQFFKEHMHALLHSDDLCFEWNHQKSDGSVFPVEVKPRKFKLDGKTYFLGIWHDLTEHKRIEEEWRMAKEAAEAASLAKSQFLANMSHEIRTPMNGILGVIDLLEKTKLTKEQKSYLNIIHTSGEVLLRIISDVLDLSKIESNNLCLESIPFEVRPYLKETVDLMEVGAREKGLQIILNVEDNVPTWVISDPQRIRQILFNIISNSIKFTESGEITILVKKYVYEKEENIYHPQPLNHDNLDGISSHHKNDEAKDDDHDHLKKDEMIYFSIRDTGIGMSEKVKEKIFHPFVQADESTSRRYGGTGLGLVITKSLVTLMGGEIWLESKLGVGSTFRFTIKIKPMKTLSLVQTKLKTQISIHHPNLKNLQVLVVEDNKVNQLVLTKMLSGLNLNYEVVDDGLKALNMCECKEFHIIFMDCHMPVMDGYEATSRIRNLEKEGNRRKSCIVALTASALNHDKERCLGIGMDDFLTKPIKSMDVKRIVAKYLHSNNSLLTVSSDENPLDDC